MPTFHFIITLHSESAHQLSWCAKHLRRSYPTDIITVVTDGCHRDEWRAVCQQYRLAYIPHPKRLKVIGCGAHWWQRLFETATDHPADFTVKIDADTMIHRPLTKFPGFDIFGSLQKDGAIQGGFQAFTRFAVQRIIESQVCLDDTYSDPSNWATNPVTMAYVLNKQEISTDYVLTHIAAQLQLTCGNSTEIDSLWQIWRPFRTDGVCVTHPHKVTDPSRSFGVRLAVAPPRFARSKTVH